jgi:hypothetical protein
MAMWASEGGPLADWGTPPPASCQSIQIIGLGLGVLCQSLQSKDFIAKVFNNKGLAQTICGIAAGFRGFGPIFSFQRAAKPTRAR